MEPQGEASPCSHEAGMSRGQVASVLLSHDEALRAQRQFTRKEGKKKRRTRDGVPQKGREGDQKGSPPGVPCPDRECGPTEAVHENQRESERIASLQEEVKTLKEQLQRAAQAAQVELQHERRQAEAERRRLEEQLCREAAVCKAGPLDAGHAEESHSEAAQLEDPASMSLGALRAELKRLGVQVFSGTCRSQLALRLSDVRKQAEAEAKGLDLQDPAEMSLGALRAELTRRGVRFNNLMRCRIGLAKRVREARQAAAAD